MSFRDMINATLLNNANNNIKNTKQIQTEYLSGYNRTDNYNYGGPPLLGNNQDVYKNTTFNMLNNMKGGMSDHNYGNQMFKRTAKSMKIQDDINEGQSLGNNLPSTKDDAFQTVESSLELFFNDVINAEFTNEPIKQQEIRQTLGNFRTYGLNISKSSLTRYSKILEDTIGSYLTRMDSNSNYFIETYNNLTQATKKGAASHIQIYVKNLSQLANQELLYKLFLIIQSLLNSYGNNEKSRTDVFKIQYMDIIKANPRDIMPSKYIDIVEEAQSGLKDLKDAFPNIYKEMDKQIKKLQEATDNRQENIDKIRVRKAEKELEDAKVKNIENLNEDDLNVDFIDDKAGEEEFKEEEDIQPGGEAADQDDLFDENDVLFSEFKNEIEKKPSRPSPPSSRTRSRTTPTRQPQPRQKPSRAQTPSPKRGKIKGGRSIKFVDKMLSSWGL